MHRLALSVYFIEFPWEKRAAIEAGIEGAVLFLCSSPHLDSAQDLIPAVLGSLFHLGKGLPVHFTEIKPGLFKGDERRCSLHVDLLSPYRAELH